MSAHSQQPVHDGEGEYLDHTDLPLGYLVVDAFGQSLGVLTAVYEDSDTGATIFGAVTMIRRGRRRAVFVPLDDATPEVTGRRLVLRCGRDLARRAPAVQPGRELPVADEPQLYAHYDREFERPHTGRRLVRRVDHQPPGRRRA